VSDKILSNEAQALYQGGIIHAISHSRVHTYTD